MHEKVYNTLKHICGVYLSFSPQEVEAPFILYRQISRIYNHDLDGRSSLEKARFQFDIYAYSFLECKELCEQVRDALDGKAFEVNYIEEYEDATGLFRIILDFHIWEDQI